MEGTTHKLSIDGMTCPCCSGRLTKALNATPGVLQAVISHETHSGVVITNDSISIDQLAVVVADTGFQLRI